jgi:hypothetical protein
MNELTVFSPGSYDKSLEICTALSRSNLVPKDFQGKPENILIAMEISQRTNSSLLAVMQSLNIIQGRPTFGSKYIIAAINSTGKFSPLRFQFEDEDSEREVTFSYTVWENGNKSKREGKTKIKNRKCKAYCTDKSTGETLYSPEVSLEMAVQEGWYTKDGSKWKTMPELMLMYRSATMFGGIYAPEVTMGMSSKEEIEDISDMIPPVKTINPKIEPVQKSIPVSTAEKVKAKLLESIVEPVQELRLDDLIEMVSNAKSLQELDEISKKDFDLDDADKKIANQTFKNRKKALEKGGETDVTTIPVE